MIYEIHHYKKDGKLIRAEAPLTGNGPWKFFSSAVLRARCGNDTLEMPYEFTIPADNISEAFDNLPETHAAAEQEAIRHHTAQQQRIAVPQLAFASH